MGKLNDIWPKLLEDFENNRLKPFYKQDCVVDLSIIPPLIEERKLIENKRKLHTVEATRGCTVGCAFCSCTNRPYYRAFRTRPIETMAEEIAHIPTKYFTFVDSSFTFNSKYSKQLLSRITEFNKKFATNANINTLATDEDLLKISAESGMSMYVLGLETISQDNLKSVGKKTHKISEYKSVIKKIHDYGIGVFGYFVFGFEDDTTSVFRETLDFIYDIEIDNAGFCILTPFPSTPLFKQFDEQKRLLSKNWSDYYECNVVFKPKNMTPDELLNGTLDIAKEFYSSVQMIKREIRSLLIGFSTFYMETAGNYLYSRWVKQY